ncbi:MAG: hypothetical protein J0L60_01830 [Ignavibacteria bacterium]|nr:hypothetical protein [Ignavibacteria bacterium]
MFIEKQTNLSSYFKDFDAILKEYHPDSNMILWRYKEHVPDDSPVMSADFMESDSSAQVRLNISSVNIGVGIAFYNHVSLEDAKSRLRSFANIILKFGEKVQKISYMKIDTNIEYTFNDSSLINQYLRENGLDYFVDDRFKAFSFNYLRSFKDDYLLRVNNSMDERSNIGTEDKLTMERYRLFVINVIQDTIPLLEKRVKMNDYVFQLLWDSYFSILENNNLINFLSNKLK